MKALTPTQASSYALAVVAAGAGCCGPDAARIIHAAARGSRNRQAIQRAVVELVKSGGLEAVAVGDDFALEPGGSAERRRIRAAERDAKDRAVAETVAGLDADDRAEYERLMQRRNDRQGLSKPQRRRASAKLRKNGWLF